jgi:hypothetical protein
MNSILRKPDTGRYSISDHLEFHQLSYGICIRDITKTGDAAKINDTVKIVNPDDLITAYHDALEQEETVYKWLRKSEFTAKKADADHARDHAVKGIEAIVRNDMKHFDPAVRDNAVHLHLLLETYGNFTKADYDGETAAIDSLLTRMQSPAYDPAVQALGLAPWVNELHVQNELFKSYVDDASQEKIEKPAITPRAARHATDEALRQITNFVTSIIVLMGEESYLAEFVAEFNVLVNHYNTLVHEHYGRLHARIDITPAIIDPIAEQPFTGKPVFVIPGVTLVVKQKDGSEKTVVLEFTKDFTVAYEHNVNVGTATLHINGIDKYVGTLTTTFNIVMSYEL